MATHARSGPIPGCPHRDDPAVGTRGCNPRRQAGQPGRVPLQTWRPGRVPWATSSRRRRDGIAQSGGADDLWRSARGRRQLPSPRRQRSGTTVRTVRLTWATVRPGGRTVHRWCSIVHHSMSLLSRSASSMRGTGGCVRIWRGRASAYSSDRVGVRGEMFKRWAREGVIPVAKPGRGSFRFKREDLDQFLERRRTERAIAADEIPSSSLRKRPVACVHSGPKSGAEWR